MVFVPRQDSRLAQSYSLGLSTGPELIQSFGKPPKTRRLPEAMPNQVRGLNFNQAAHVAGRSGVMGERPGARGKQWGMPGRRGFATAPPEVENQISGVALVRSHSGHATPNKGGVRGREGRESQ